MAEYFSDSINAPHPLPFSEEEYGLDRANPDHLLLIHFSAGDLALLAHEVTLVEAGKALISGAISKDKHEWYAGDARRRIQIRRDQLGLPPRGM